MQIAAWPGFWGEIDDGMERTHEGKYGEGVSIWKTKFRRKKILNFHKKYLQFRLMCAIVMESIFSI